ncbi:MAG: hypothetical protein WCF90_05205 [Methanomicrobiales archaeon]
MGHTELPVHCKASPTEDPAVVEERRKVRGKEFINLLHNDALHYRWKAAVVLGEGGIHQRLSLSFKR